MKNIFVVLFSSLLFLGSVTAQNFNLKIDLPKNSVNSKKLNSDSLKILAVMVEFAKDKDTQTYGDGKFGSIYSKDYGKNILDPLPHNQQYFEDHLTFVKNYFEKVSSGKLNVAFSVLPDIYTVSEPMRNYSPSPDSKTFGELGKLSQEVWNLVDSLNPGFNFADYDMFVIFHAGVSRGLITPGSIGLERDIPSIFLNLEAFKKIYGNQFNGFPVEHGNFKIDNTAIMPETDSREIDGITGKSLIQLTTNGLLCTTVANYLGVPDLFDTQTGKSAIGRFGLMDPQGFYAYEGIFPPEPSPWVKVFLGWETPVTINLKDVRAVLTAQRAAFPGDTTLIKVPLNADEYYLIENRSRDAHKDGAIVTYKVGGQTFTKTFRYDVDGFRFFNVDTIKGVVTDIDEPDWAVPGIDVNDVEGKFEDVGIVIWHIDQKVISANLAANSVNADKNHRGVFIEEADGIFDIGNDFDNILTGSVETREAFKTDTWYKSNPSKLYKNIFDAESKPSTVTNLGANTFISFSNFSDVGIKMSFNLSFGGDVIKPLLAIKFPYSFSPQWLTYAQVKSGEYFLTQNKQTKNVIEIDSLGNYIKLNNFNSDFKPAVVISDAGYYVLGSFGNNINILANHSANNFSVSAAIPDSITTPLIVSSNKSDAIEFYFGTVSGKIIEYQFQISNRSFQKLNEVQAFSSTKAVRSIALNSDKYFAISSHSFFDYKGNKITFPFNLNQIVLTQSKTSDYLAIVSFSGEVLTAFSGTQGGMESGFYVIKNGEVTNTIERNFNGIISKFSLADIKNTGNNFILSVEGNKIGANNLQGNFADYFPINFNNNDVVIPAPLSADLDLDGRMDLLVATQDGEIFSYSGSDGHVLDGFPFSSGGTISISPIIFAQNKRTSFACITDDGTFYSWNISKFLAKSNWISSNGNLLNTSFVNKANDDNNIQEYFPDNMAYNWPNPVYGSETRIRFYVAENSEANVKIFDLGGELVAELSSDAIGGFNNEIIWNVSDIQSGVYLAQLKVIANNGGQSSSKIIKIVVIK